MKRFVSYRSGSRDQRRGGAIDGARLLLDKVRAYIRHRGINTLLTYIADRDRERNPRLLAS